MAETAEMTRPTAGSEPSTLVAGLPIVLACAWPFVQFYNHNRAETAEWTTIVLGFVLSAIVAMIGYALLRLIFPSTRRSRHASLVIVLCLLFFNFNAFDILLRDILVYPADEHGFVRPRYVLLLWGVSTLIALGLAWWLAKGRRVWVVLTTVVSVALAMSLVQLATSLFTDRSAREPVATASSGAGSSDDFATKPNVYFFLLDAYARGDTLAALGDFDNGPFLETMVGKGFVNLDQSFSNYPKTYLSLGSTFTMDYLAPPGENTVGPKTAYHALLSGGNNTVRRFKENGYRFLTAARSTSYCIGFEDVCVRGDRDIGLVSIGELEVSLLQMTPLLTLLKRIFPEQINFEDIFPEVVQASILTDVYGPDAPTGRPAFFFYHNMAAHGSQYNLGCDRVSLYDRPLKAVHSLEGMPAYFKTIECLNEKFIALTDEILERDPDAIILIQSDHGVALDKWKAFNEWSEQDFLFRFGVLNLLLLPESCRDSAYPTMSPVNTFRLVFACLTKQPPDFLPDESYWVDDLAADEVILWRSHNK